MSKSGKQLEDVWTCLVGPADLFWHIEFAAKVIDSGSENTFLQKQEFNSALQADLYDSCATAGHCKEDGCYKATFTSTCNKSSTDNQLWWEVNSVNNNKKI